MNFNFSIKMKKIKLFLCIHPANNLNEFEFKYNLGAYTVKLDLKHIMKAFNW